jgi:hypothetical protein
MCAPADLAGAAAPREDPVQTEDAGMSPELRALYEQFERASGAEARQEIWNAIVAHKRQREERVGTAAEAEAKAVAEEHKKRRRLWPFF